LLYVAASYAAVSASLVQEKQDGQEKRQVPVYFISKVLSPSKKNYTELEKVLYVVLMASRKLWHYFQSYHSTFFSASQRHNKKQRSYSLQEELGSGLQS
jgi:hypothetical protein